MVTLTTMIAYQQSSPIFQIPSLVNIRVFALSSQFQFILSPIPFSLPYVNSQTPAQLQFTFNYEKN